MVFTDKLIGFGNFKRHCITKVLTDDYRMILCFDKKQSKLIIDSYTKLNFIFAGFNFVSAELFFSLSENPSAINMCCIWMIHTV